MSIEAARNYGDHVRFVLGGLTFAPLYISILNIHNITACYIYIGFKILTHVRTRFDFHNFQSNSNHQHCYLNPLQPVFSIPLTFC